MHASVEATLAFSKPDRVQPDPARGGLLREAGHELDPDPASTFDLRPCTLHDLCAPQLSARPFELSGFETIDLSPLDGLQRVLEAVRRQGEISEDNAAAIRAALRGRVFELAGGKRLRLLFVAPEGLIMRTAGPDGLKVNPDAVMTEMNGHDGAVNVHADQDVHGSPLRQIMRGTAPWLFRHESPDGANRVSPLFIVNIWIPLQQITRPLTLMDTGTLDRRRHQTCYSFSTDHFLERDEATRVNDLWTCLHDPGQQWYFHSRMDARRAYVFDTLGTPHGSVKLPGEAQAARGWRALDAMCRASDGAALLEAADRDIPDCPAGTPAPLRAAVDEMRAVIGGGAEAAAAGGLPDDDWRRRATAARDAVVRKSVELRAVALLSPLLRPLRRQR